MKNFIFLSPNFPDNYWNFCAKLKENGLNVLGIGDCPYDELRYELKNSLNEYYKVGSLENYDEVYRAVAFFTYKYGRIDWLESNNEYWLERDARLRRDFNITSGFMPEDMEAVKFKSKMKANYTKAGIPVARYHMVDNYENCRKFIEEIGGYPVVVKPDNGVGASDTHKLKSDEQLKDFLDHRLPVEYIMEEFITGDVISFDAVINSQGVPIFETGNITPNGLMDIVNNADNCLFMIRDYLPENLKQIGERTVKAFGVKSRFVHLEFFQLSKDQYLGKKDDIVALEVNMRPSGGVSPTMMNYANSTDVYEIWADMIAYDATDKGQGIHKNCVFCGRRSNKNFAYTREQLYAIYGSRIVQDAPVEPALRSAMGDYMFMALCDTMDDVRQFVNDVFREKE